ncbi:hypothetical protein AB4095_03555 [Bilophila wadsworthia]|uniref:hypothetical protein n=1 Tax=Bilophila wadsworthia TaxID=35833 RepID=UPI0034CFF143
MCYGTNCGREGAFGTCYHPEDCIMRAIERDAEENLAARLARDTALSREHFPCPNCLEQGERHSLTCENGLFTCPECGGETVSCDRFEDRTTMEVVWCDSVTGKEISRRPMTAEERQHRLELVTPDKPADNGEGRAEVLTLPVPPAANARTCLSCRHLSADGTEKAEPCMACAQANGGDADNWEPRRECKTCAHVTSTVDGFPCGGCSLNPDPGHGGDEDRWTWKDAPKERIPC